MAVVSAVPDLVLLKAVAAGSRRDSAGIELGVLVEGYNVGRVPVAEDVTALSAVVSAGEVVEVALAGRVIADCRLQIVLEEDR